MLFGRMVWQPPYTKQSIEIDDCAYKEYSLPSESILEVRDEWTHYDLTNEEEHGHDTNLKITCTKQIKRIYPIVQCVRM